MLASRKSGAIRLTVGAAVANRKSICFASHVWMTGSENVSKFAIRRFPESKIIPRDINFCTRESTQFPKISKSERRATSRAGIRRLTDIK